MILGFQWRLWKQTDRNSGNVSLAEQWQREEVQRRRQRSGDKQQRFCLKLPGVVLLGLQWRLQKQIGSDVATERGLALGTHLAPDPSAEAHGL